MGMTKIIDKLPGLHLHARFSIAGALQLRHAGVDIQRAKQDLARKITEMILGEQKFFSAREQHGGVLIDVWVDCHVLTADELRAELSECFRLGVERCRYI